MILPTIPAGRPLIHLGILAYLSDSPFMINGSYGIGKSDIVRTISDILGIGYVMRDLSLMEPPDMLGLPRVDKNNRTHYASPAFLPTSGRGLFVLEEPNRAQRYMQNSVMQLLSARALNDYTLPPGWVPCATMNDASHGAQVEQMDPALLSRFVRVNVEASPEEWLQWASSDGGIEVEPAADFGISPRIWMNSLEYRSTADTAQVHEKVREFIASCPGVFKDSDANPRAWTRVSEILRTWEGIQMERGVLETAIAGVVGQKWATAFLACYDGKCSPLTPKQIIEDYPIHRSTLQVWIDQGRIDAVLGSLEGLKNHLIGDKVYETVVADRTGKKNVETFLSDLPPDFKPGVRKWLGERGWNSVTVPRIPR